MICCDDALIVFDKHIKNGAPGKASFQKGIRNEETLYRYIPAGKMEENQHRDGDRPDRGEGPMTAGDGNPVGPEVMRKGVISPAGSYDH